MPFVPVRTIQSHTEARAAAYLRTNDAVRAIQDLDEVVRRDPANLAAYTNRSVADLALGQSEAAIRDASEAIRLRPDGAAAAYSNRASGLERRGGRDSGAAADYDRAVVINPRLPTPMSVGATAMLGPAEADADQAKTQQLGTGTTVSPRREKLLEDTRTRRE